MLKINGAASASRRPKFREDTPERGERIEL
jgi:hypothetical protein